jgi:hypothetical protein
LFHQQELLAEEVLAMAIPYQFLELAKNTKLIYNIFMANHHDENDLGIDFGDESDSGTGTQDATIRINERKRPQLAAKLNEYRDRYRKYSADPTKRSRISDTRAKIAALSILLDQGTVSLGDVVKRICEEAPRIVVADPKAIGVDVVNAFGIIASYNQGSHGKNTIGGTGLPEDRN